MRAVFALLTVCVAGCAIAMVSSTNIVKHHRKAHAHSHVTANGAWQAPLPTDCRSPCPALNTLANHGLIPRDGKNLDEDTLHHALIDILNLGDVFGTMFAKAAAKKFANPATGKFSLCDLLINLHSKDQPSGKTGIEHSASLTRLDRPNGDFSHATDNTQRSPVASQINVLLSSSTDKKMITVPNLMAARAQLWAKSYAAQPALKSDPLDKQQRIIADVEGCLLLGALSGNSNGGKFQISTAYAQSILLHERLPDGWSKTPEAFGLPELFSCLAQEGQAWAKARLDKAIIELSQHWGLSLSSFM